MKPPKSARLILAFLDQSLKVLIILKMFVLRSWNLQNHFACLAKLLICSYQEAKMQTPRSKVLIYNKSQQSPGGLWNSFIGIRLTLLNPYRTWTRFGSIKPCRSNDKIEVNGTASGSPESKTQDAYTSSLIRWRLFLSQNLAICLRVSEG
jgi:hypothetical protein